MAAIPDDVSHTLAGRFITVRREDLPADFADQPAQTLAALKDRYVWRVREADADLAARYDDWGVRVALDGAGSVPVGTVRANNINRWIECRGVVSRVWAPAVRELHTVWKCGKCGASSVADADAEVPEVCECGPRSIRRDMAASKFVNSQRILLTELSEDVASLPPGLLDCVLDGTLVSSLVPGDRCVVGGVLTVRQTKAGYRYVLEANNVARHDAKVPPTAPTIPGDVVKRLVESFAPHIHGHNRAKEFIILQLAGGSGAVAGRSGIHVLLVGDHEMAKSEILREAAAVALPGWYMSAHDTDGATVTASVTSDDDGTYVDAGAAVLVDDGLLCLDEFDSIAEADRASLHEVMEQQTVSIAKMGVTITMNAGASVLAAATRHTDLPESLTARFDAVLTMMDVPGAATDRLVARRILNGRPTEALPRESITAYLEAVRPLRPAMTDEATVAAESYYVAARALYGGQHPTPRQMASVVRLAGAYAKIRRHDGITIDDVNSAAALLDPAGAAVTRSDRPTTTENQP